MSRLAAVAAAATPARIWALLGLAFGGGALLWSVGPHARLGALGLVDTLPDATPFASGSAVLRWLADLTLEGAEAYGGFLLLDLVHGPLLPLALGLAVLRAGGVLRRAAWLGLAAAVADVLENLLLLVLLDTPSPSIAAIAASVTTVKLMAFVGLLAAVAAWIALAGWRGFGCRLRRARSAPGRA